MKTGAPELEPENTKKCKPGCASQYAPDEDFSAHRLLWVLSFSGNYKSVCKYIAWHSFNYRTLQIFLIQSSATTIVIQIKFVHIFKFFHLNRWYNYHVYLP